MGELTQVRIVAGREIREAARRKAIWIAAAILLVASIAGMVLPSLLGNDDPDRLGSFGEPAAGATDAIASTAEAAGIDIEFVEVDGRDAAVAQVGDGDLVGAVGFDEPVELITADGDDQTLEAVVRQALASADLVERLGDAGLTSAQVDEILTPEEIRATTLEGDSDSRRGVAAVASVVLYILLLGLMNMVANSVAIEKVHGVSEVLLPNVEARTLLAGKVLGIWAIGMVPLAAGALPLLVKAILGGSLPAGTMSVLASGIAWYVLGAVLYLFAAGALGSLVERQEEVGSAVSSLSIILVGSYLASFATDSSISAVLAWIPLSSPMVEPPRIATGAASTVEMVGSFVLLVIGTVVTARVATVVYRRAVVRTDTRLKLREVLSS